MAAEMAQDALKIVNMRSDFYRDGYRRSLLIIVFLVIINVLMSMIVFSLYNQKPEVKFFATSTDGRIIPIEPLSKPGFSNAELLDWSSRAAIKLYSYDYVNYRDDLQTVSEMFTGRGWQSFQDALTKSRMLKTVISQRLVMNAVPTGAPTIVEQGILGGKYTWKIRIPMLVKLQGTQSLNQPVQVTMLVQRVSLVNNPKGVGIINFIVSEG